MCIDVKALCARISTLTQLIRSLTRSPTLVRLGRTSRTCHDQQQLLQRKSDCGCFQPSKPVLNCVQLHVSVCFGVVCQSMCCRTWSALIVPRRVSVASVLVCRLLAVHFNSSNSYGKSFSVRCNRSSTSSSKTPG